MTFLDISLIDLIDILLVAVLLHQVYLLLKGTSAMKIFTGIAAMYLLWLLVRALNMQLLSTILGQVMGVGVIALLIVFQQEVRSFFMNFSNKYLSKIDFSLDSLFSFVIKNEVEVKIWTIIKATINMSKTKTGALIVITKDSELLSYIETGTLLNAETSSRLLENIFFKNSPLHDGAVIITKDKIKAASCILPVSDKQNLPEDFGLRHRAAHGLCEQNDSIIIVVSEETGKISTFKTNEYKIDVGISELKNFLKAEFITEKEQKNNMTIQ